MLDVAVGLLAIKHPVLLHDTLRRATSKNSQGIGPDLATFRLELSCGASDCRR